MTARLEHPDGRRGPVFPWARMGAAALLRAAADAGLHVTGQWRHGDRAFVCVTHRQQRLPLEGDERPRAESAACVKNKDQIPPERSRLTLPPHGDLTRLASQSGG